MSTTRTSRGAPADELTPKYLRICREITEAIETGRLRPGQALPSQRELAEHFGVTVMTLRQALRVLAEQDHLRIEHGRGTFVADRTYRLPLDGLSSFVQQIVQTGRSLRSEVLAAGEVPAPHGVPARMGLAGDRVFCLTRLRFVDDEPLVYSMSLLHPEDGHRLDLRRSADSSLYDTLAGQLEIVVDRAVETFRATLLGEVEAAALHRDVGGPALVSSRLTYAGGRAVVDDRVIMPGDAVALSAERRVDDLNLRLRLPADGDLLVQLFPDRPASAGSGTNPTPLQEYR